jgi:two-component system response regulator MtrA
MPRLLIVEDDEDMVFALRRNLEQEGYEVAHAADGRAGLAAVREGSPDLVLLDLMLPAMDGYSALRAMRAEGWNIPVVLLSARSAEVDKVHGFRLGADDYVTKPFGLQELVSRIGALLRRVEQPRTGAASSPTRVLQFADVELDASARTVRRRGADVELTPRAFDLLMVLLRRQGEVVRREELMRDVWAYAPGATSRTLDAHIAELRRKLEPEANDARYIQTVWKVGYRLRTTDPT